MIDFHIFEQYLILHDLQPETNLAICLMPKKIKLEIIKGCDDNAYAQNILQVQIRECNWFIRN